MPVPVGTKERDLYPPVKTWLESQGYRVRGEVGRCDVAAEKDGELIVLELKLRPSLALLAQAAERQEYADAVYVALPSTTDRPSPAGKEFRRLLKRLGVGLVDIRLGKRKTSLQVLLHPGEGETRRKPRRKGVLLREINGRDLDLIAGGSATSEGRFTAYRQRALRLAAWLDDLGEASPARLRELGAPEDPGSMLSRNLYGWFTRERRGVYSLHKSGREALERRPELKARYLTELKEKKSHLS